MQICIPTIGEVITLTKSWEFNLNSVNANYNFWKLAFPNESNVSNSVTWNTFTKKNSRLFGINKGSVLKIDKIENKRNYGSFASVYLSLLHDSSGEFAKRLSFCVKLQDANKIVCELGDKRDV